MSSKFVVKVRRNGNIFRISSNINNFTGVEYIGWQVSKWQMRLHKSRRRHRINRICFQNCFFSFHVKTNPSRLRKLRPLPKSLNLIIWSSSNQCTLFTYSNIGTLSRSNFLAPSKSQLFDINQTISIVHCVPNNPLRSCILFNSFTN